MNGDEIYNGALDNASGVAAVLEIARAFTSVEPRPKRSILFLMVGAEEQGLLGAQHYAEQPIYPLAKTLANINIDGVNQWGRTKDITVIGMGASDLDDYLRDAAPNRDACCGRIRSRRRASTTDRITSTSPSRGAGALHRHRHRLRRQACRVQPAEARRVHEQGLPRTVRRDKA